MKVPPCPVEAYRDGSQWPTHRARARIRRHGRARGNRRGRIQAPAPVLHLT